MFNQSNHLKRHLVQHDSVQYGAGPASPKQRKIDNPRDHYNITKERIVQSSKFNTDKTVFKVAFKDLEIETLPEVMTTLHKIFECVIEDTTNGADPKDKIQMGFRSTQMDYPITTPVVECRELNADIVLSEIERVLQSHEEFVLDSTVEIDVTRVAIPVA